MFDFDAVEWLEAQDAPPLEYDPNDEWTDEDALHDLLREMDVLA